MPEIRHALLVLVRRVALAVFEFPGSEHGGRLLNQPDQERQRLGGNAPLVNAERPHPAFAVMGPHPCSCFSGRSRITAAWSASAFPLQNPSGG